MIFLKKNEFIEGALIATIAIIVSKILGVPEFDSFLKVKRLEPFIYKDLQAFFYIKIMRNVNHLLINSKIFLKSL